MVWGRYLPAGCLDRRRGAGKNKCDDKKQGKLDSGDYELYNPSQDFPWAAATGPFPSSKGSGLWASIAVLYGVYKDSEFGAETKVA